MIAHIKKWSGRAQDHCGHDVKDLSGMAVSTRVAQCTKYQCLFTEEFERMVMRIDIQSKAGAVAATRKPFIEQIDRLEGLMNNYSVDDIETDAFRQ